MEVSGRLMALPRGHRLLEGGCHVALAELSSLLGELTGFARVVVLGIRSEEIDDDQLVTGVERGAGRLVH